MAERELAMTGIGGQGVQFAAQVMSRGAIAEGRQVMMFGSYGGMMRGGNPGSHRLASLNVCRCRRRSRPD